MEESLAKNFIMGEILISAKRRCDAVLRFYRRDFGDRLLCGRDVEDAVPKT